VIIIKVNLKMEYLKATTTLLVAGTGILNFLTLIVSFFTYQKIKEAQYRKDTVVTCERVYQELLIDSYSIVTLKYKKLMMKKDDEKKTNHPTD
jgi:hypothetical protein